MKFYKKILIGLNTFSPDWIHAIKNLNIDNIIITDFSNIDNVKKIIIERNIDYILPLSQKDYYLIKIIIPNNELKILYPDEEIYLLLNNKLLFTRYMLENFKEYIPKVYYLDNVKLSDIEYPVIFKPEYSTNGLKMKIDILWRLQNK